MNFSILVFLPHSSMNFINIKDDSEIEYDHVNKNNIKSDKNYIKKLKENIDTLESDKSVFYSINF